MEYPIWQLTTLAGGFWIALIATLHIFVAQFAVGGGLFLVLTERMARKRNSPGLLDYVKKHAKFFLLLSMVFGGVTGVGIWFTITLLSPLATSSLIHTFVFAWAAEWVCFLAEILALLIYFYKFDTMNARDHMIIGWLYFLFAWLSLLLINGIVGFMLTPGDWLQTGNFWDGYINPTFWTSLVTRTFLAFTLAGLFGFVTSTRIADDDLRQTMVRTCAAWTLAPLALFVLSAIWYVTALPPEQLEMVTVRSHRVASYIRDFWFVVPLVALGGLLLAVRMPRKISFPLALGVLLCGLATVGAFEFTRESARKPYVIYNHIYASSIRVADVDRLNTEGVLASAKWVPDNLRQITADNALEAGAMLFQVQCSPCHSINGPMNDILPKIAKFPIQGMSVFLNGMGKINSYMPPFIGTNAERMALGRYLVENLNNDSSGTGNAVFEPLDMDLTVPPFDAQNDDYVLLAWNNLGMHCISDSNRNWILLPPANDLFGMLVKRGSQPELLTEGITISYAVEKGFEHPAEQTDFWKYAKSFFGVELEPGIGLAGNGVSGPMHNAEGMPFFEAKLIPVVPYPDNGGYMPFPMFTVEAHDAASGNLLAQTKVVAPTATEMGCRSCHGGPWIVEGLAGISDETGQDVIATHDRMSGTDLVARAEAGKPVLCQSCHPDPVLGSKGDPENYPGLLNLPAALHGLHANYLAGYGEEACHMCHPNRPDGPTGCLRGVHKESLVCTDCHGYLEDHALSLLKREKEDGKPFADRLMANLTPRTVDSVDKINPRTPWMQEPDCLTCHEEFEQPQKTNAYNTWTEGGAKLYRNRNDDMDAVPCIACHNSPHSTYPATNAYGKDRDNMQPLQYMGVAQTIGANGQCSVCHKEAMDYPAHHPGMGK